MECIEGTIEYFMYLYVFFGKSKVTNAYLSSMVGMAAWYGAVSWHSVGGSSDLIERVRTAASLQMMFMKSYLTWKN